MIIQIYVQTNIIDHKYEEIKELMLNEREHTKKIIKTNIEKAQKKQKPLYVGLVWNGHGFNTN